MKPLGPPDDSDTHSEFVAFYQAGKLHRYFRKRGCDASLCDDLANETSKKALAYPKSKEGSFNAWIYRIAKSVFADFVKSRSNTKSKDSEPVVIIPLDQFQDLTVNYPDQHQNFQDPERAMMQREEEDMKALRTNQVKSVIEGLPPRRRRVILLRVKGYKIKEIATLMNLQHGTVKAHLTQAKQQIRDRLGPDFMNDFDV